MEKEEIYKKICTGNAIIITGSGAHVGAVNTSGEKFLTGTMLASYLYEKASINELESNNDLADAAESYLEVYSPEDLINEIKKLFSVGTINDYHRFLYGQAWKRVYTTNYDNIAINATQYKGSECLKPITLTTEYNEKLLDHNLCVYINGYIGNLNRTSLESEFKLTENSYMKITDFQATYWGNLFSEDLETSSLIIVVGLSLEYDLDLKRFICNQSTKDRVVFIQSESVPDVLQRKLSRMGFVLPIGVEKFAKELQEFSEKNKGVIEESKDSNYEYHSFEEYKDKVSLEDASAADVYDMFMYGRVNNRIWKRKNGKYKNILYRENINRVIKYLNDGCKTIFLHANLGNGKTLFLDLLKHKLQNRDYKIYTLVNSYEGITAKEISSIGTVPGKKIIIIENYYNYIKEIRQFALYPNSNIQYIFTARSVMYDVRVQDVCEYLSIEQGNVPVIDLNRMTDGEINKLSCIFSENGLWGRHSNLSSRKKCKLLKDEKNGNKQFQGVLLWLIKSESIKFKIEEIVNKINSEKDKKFHILILALLIKVMSLNITPVEVSNIMKVNIAFDALFKSDKNIKELLDFSSGKGEFCLKSSVTANFILQELKCNDAIIDVLTATAKYFNCYKNIEKCENVLKNIVSFSHVKAFLIWNSQKESYILKYYDQIKELSYYRENTFFWLQYAMVCIYIGKYNLAQTYLDNAYAYFKNSSDSTPFQVDTQQANLYLNMILHCQNINIEEYYHKAHNLLLGLGSARKDNPVKALSMFSLYVNYNFEKIITEEGLIDLHKQFCREAYNKINSYVLNNNLSDYSIKKLNSLAKKLLRAAV